MLAYHIQASQCAIRTKVAIRSRRTAVPYSEYRSILRATRTRRSKRAVFNRPMSVVVCEHRKHTEKPNDRREAISVAAFGTQAVYEVRVLLSSVNEASQRGSLRPSGSLSIRCVFKLQPYRFCNYKRWFNYWISWLLYRLRCIKLYNSIFCYVQQVCHYCSRID